MENITPEQVINQWAKEQREDFGVDGNPFFNPISCKEFGDLELPKENWLIKKLIPREGLIILASPSGEKKTWIAMEIAKSVASGEDFLGNQEFKTQKGNVLYLNMEMSKTEFQRRVRLLGLNKQENILLLRSNDLNLNDEERKSIEQFKEFVDDKEIKLVVIDTFRAIAGGLNEDKAEEVRKFLDLFKVFKDKGVAILFLDHCRKPIAREGREPKKEQLIGSQDKVASIESLLMIKSEERNDEILIYHKKSRSGVEYPTFRVKMTDVMDSSKDEIDIMGIELKYSGLEEEKDYKIDVAKEAVLDLLYTGERTRQDILDLIMASHNIGSKNASEAIRELTKEKKIAYRKIGRENSYRIAKDELAVREEELFGELKEN